MYGMLPRTQSPQATGSRGVTPQRTTASDIASLVFGLPGRGKGASPAETPSMTTPQRSGLTDPPVTPRFAQNRPTRSGRTLVGQE